MESAVPNKTIYVSVSASPRAASGASSLLNGYDVSQPDPASHVIEGATALSAECERPDPRNDWDRASTLSSYFGGCR
jgi:hypothetical protein